MRRMFRGDGGSAAIEFVGLSVVLLLPVVYALLTVFQLQRAAFGVSQAAREAGRAYATAPSSGVAADRAREAADLAVIRAELADLPLVVGQVAGPVAPLLAAAAYLYSKAVFEDGRVDAAWLGADADARLGARLFEEDRDLGRLGL